MREPYLGDIPGEPRLPSRPLPQEQSWFERKRRVIVSIVALLMLVASWIVALKMPAAGQDCVLQSMTREQAIVKARALLADLSAVRKEIERPNLQQDEKRVLLRRIENQASFAKQVIACDDR